VPTLAGVKSLENRRDTARPTEVGFAGAARCGVSGEDVFVAASVLWVRAEERRRRGANSPPLLRADHARYGDLSRSIGFKAD